MNRFFIITFMRIMTINRDNDANNNNDDDDDDDKDDPENCRNTTSCIYLSEGIFFCQSKQY